MPGMALQLYTMREPAKQDLHGTLKRIRETGWEYVQWSGMPELPAEAIRDTLAEAGLKAIAAHCAMEPFETGFDAAVQYWKTVGVTDVAPGGMMSDCRDTLDAWMRGAVRLDAIGARLNEAGLRLSYHNHDFEFGYFDGDTRCKIDILYAETAQERLRAEWDVAWIQFAGADPAGYLRRYAGRAPVIHVKELAAERRDGRAWFVPLGRGILDWPSIFAAGREACVEWYIYEQDTCDGDIFDDIRVSREFLCNALGG